jgi:hypothetical protein
MNVIKMEVNQKGTGNKYEKVGEVDIHVPTLTELFPEAVKQSKDDKGAVVEEDGLPVYEDDKHNWLQGAIFAMVKAQARNKLKPKTAQLKDGQKIASTWEELTAEGERVGNGEALKLVAEAKKAFSEYVKGLGKSANAQQTLNLLFSNKQALSLQSAENKTKMQNYVTEFATSLDEAVLAKYEKYIQGILNACEVTTEADDF